MPPFPKGVSGNPKGKPKGAKNWRTKVREQLETSAPIIIQDLISRAPKNLKIALFLVDKSLPAASHRALPIASPIVLTGTPADRADQITQALAAGVLSLDESAALLGALSTASTIRSNEELADRLDRVEKLLAKGKIDYVE